MVPLEKQVFLYAEITLWYSIFFFICTLFTKHNDDSTGVWGVIMLNNSPEVWSWQYTNIRSTFYSSSRSFLFLYFSYSVFSCSVISCIAVVCCCFVQGNLFSWLCVFGCWVLKLSQKLGYFSFPSNEYIHAIYLAIHLHTFVFIMLLIQHSMPMHCLKYATFFFIGTSLHRVVPIIQKLSGLHRNVEDH